MPNLAKLALAVVIAVVAGGLNMLYLNSKTESRYFLALSNDQEVKEGEPFPHDATKYKKIPMVGDSSQLYKTLIPYDEVNKGALVYDAKAARDMKGGDPIFFRDIADDTPRYNTLGPFTLLSVGDQLTGRVEASSRGEGSVITIQPEYVKDKEFNEDTRRLIQILDAQSRKQSETPSHLKILQVIAHPATGKSPGSETGSTAKVYQAADAIFVPLPNAKVSGVLQIGTKVSFLVPAYP
jgi:hypothetical protein